MKHNVLLLVLVCLPWLACRLPPAQVPTPRAPYASHPLEAAALALTEGPFVTYDASYQSMAYPMGDVAPNRGVCADVVVRAFRSLGMDLQQLVHEDMRLHFAAYPRKWGLQRPDPNIDHRRVPNLMCFFDRQGWSQPCSQQPQHYRPGDIVAWQLSQGALTHIGIVVQDPLHPGKPRVVHNIGQGQRMDDVLFSWPIIGHYRLPN